jgi:serine/threonine protein kinase
MSDTSDDFCQFDKGVNIGAITNIMKFRNYKLGAKIGNGGHAFVYRIDLQDKKSGDTFYALKIIDISDKKDLADFKKEKDIMKRLAKNSSSSDISCVVDSINCYLRISEKDGCGFIVTELYDGDLSRYLEKHGSFWNRFIRNNNPAHVQKVKLSEDLINISNKAQELIEDSGKVENFVNSRKMPHTRILVAKVINDANDLVTHITRIKNDVSNQLKEYSKVGDKQKREDIVKQFVSWVSQMAGAVKYLHDNNMAHGDIKPQNILVRPPDKIVLTDFDTLYYYKNDGSQKKDTDLLFDPQPITPIYASPQLEQLVASSKKVSLYDIKTSDIWALALTILSCWFGEDDMAQKLNARTGSPRIFAAAIYGSLRDETKAMEIFSNIQTRCDWMAHSYPPYRHIFEDTLCKSLSLLYLINQNKHTPVILNDYINGLINLKVN